MKLKIDIKIALKRTAIKLQANPIKIYHTVYICEKKKKCQYHDQHYT